LSEQNTTNAIQKHAWAAGGVSGYPLAHPIVGQDQFFITFRQFIHLVDHEAERFAHVFAVVAQWGVGKSRLGYELISQINSTSPGWFVRDADGTLAKADLFDDDAHRDQYLGIYIRYSQVANEYNNVDNWFAFGLYKALLPLARAVFDNSIQGQIAKEAYDRLLVKGFDEQELAAALEIDQNYSDQTLYEDPRLLTRLCEAAYACLSKYGVKYVLIVLDELETVAEAATYGLEAEDIKHLDGRAIKLMGKAIKEEDPRRKLPWLRYVALCSPAIGEELREIKSTARRFEIEELSQNAFSDVSDFVRALREDERLTEEYPEGLVEAAYAMSGRNFGWFNVIMANADEVLRAARLRRSNDRSGLRRKAASDGLPTLGELFNEMVRVSSRIRTHVLDHNAIKELLISDRTYLDAARELLYGQLPVALSKWKTDERAALLSARNEYEEPIATLYKRVEWDEQACSQALRAAKFRREGDVWVLSETDQELNLRKLLSNLSTYAIHESAVGRNGDGRHTFLVPIVQKEFIQLVSLLYPHHAAEDAARALWSHFIGSDKLPEADATHIGPSIAMIGRLDLRYHRQSHNSLIFRDPEQSNAHEQAMRQREGQPVETRAREILIGAMRLLDNNWNYDGGSAELKDAPVSVATAPPRGRGDAGGLITNNGLRLHPDGRLILSYVRSADDLRKLCDQAAQQFSTKGRTPVIAFTTSRALIDQFEDAGLTTDRWLADARSFLLLYQLTSGEEYVLQQIGIPTNEWAGFRLDGPVFTTAFDNRLRSLLRGISASTQSWRRRLNAEGRIAWPQKPGSSLRENEKQVLHDAWVYLMTKEGRPLSISHLDERKDLNVEEVVSLLGKTGVPQRARAFGYDEDERAMLFDPLDDAAEPKFPAFLGRVLDKLLAAENWTFDAARKEWFWGYTWLNSRPGEVFIEWMSLAHDLGFAEAVENTGRGEKTYTLLTRPALGGLINEAENWLRQEYPKIVGHMGEVFGEGAVQQYFAPIGSVKEGTQTRLAKQAIEKARRDLEALEADEGNRSRRVNIAEQERLFVDSTRRRLSILRSIRHVYDKDAYAKFAKDDNLHTLSFEDDSTPLWQRILRAKRFSDLVRQVDEKIRVRVDKLSEEMRAQVQGLPGFPINLFTRSFKKIEDILSGALSTRDPEGSTQRRQGTDADTLELYLKDLKIGEARNKLAQLAREAGIDLDTTQEAPLNEIDGSIARGFRNLKSSFEQAQGKLDKYQERLGNLEVILHNAPEDFMYPKDVPPFDELKNRPSFIEGSLEDLREGDAEQLLSDHDALSKLGNFQPLMQAVHTLLVEPQQAINLLAGHVQTLENAAADYRRRLLNAPDIRSIERGLNALLRANGEPERKPLDMPELEAAGSLRAAVEKRDERRSEWARRGEELLQGTGVSFERWQRIVDDLEAGRDPRLEAELDRNLVARGFLVRTYKLGGGAR
jgi:hypothetical protein